MAAASTESCVSGWISGCYLHCLAQNARTTRTRRMNSWSFSSTDCLRRRCWRSSCSEPVRTGRQCSCWLIAAHLRHWAPPVRRVVVGDRKRISRCSWQPTKKTEYREDGLRRGIQEGPQTAPLLRDYVFLLELWGWTQTRSPSGRTHNPFELPSLRWHDNCRSQLADD